MYFTLLPLPAKNALIQYYVIEGDALAFEDIQRDDPPTQKQWSKLLNRAHELWCHDNYELQTLNAEDAKAFVWENTPDLHDEYDSFEEYHSSYVAGGDIPEHPDSSWPVLAMPSCEEALVDGWHRFHSYVLAGVSSFHFINLDK